VRALRILIVIALATPVVIMPALGHWSIAPGGSGALQYLSAFMMLSVIPAAFVFFGSLVAVLVKDRYRKIAIQVLVASGVYVSASIIGGYIGEELRTRGLHAFAARSAGLVEAIRSYESQNGTPPPDLASLVPDFIAAIPSPGLADDPEYDYSTGESTKSSYQGNPWVLIVSPPAINFDTLLYFPLQNYPDQGYGGWLEKIDDWAYVNE